MFKYKPSIRYKITLAYYAVVLMMIALSVVTFLELRFIERKITFGEAITEFFDTTLEIRRFEKNYFLYQQQSDYLENRNYVAKASDLLANNLPGFETLSSSTQVENLMQSLSSYRHLIDTYAALSTRDRERNKPQSAARRTMLENRIRVIGKDIVTIAEKISKTERRSIQILLNTSQHILILSIFLLSVAVIAIGHILSKVVVKPLKLIEKNMEVIAEGRFEKITIDSRDREIASLTNAFNKMLRELEVRQRHLVQSEKLASLGTLLSGVAHELNNPLSNISSSSQILIEELMEALDKHDGKLLPDRELMKDLLSQINDQTDRARTIVRSLLEFSRDREFKKQDVQVRALIEQTIQFVKGQIPANTTIRIDVPNDLSICADRQRMQQTFLNLIKNALDAVSTDGGDILIRAHTNSALQKADEDDSIYNYLKYAGKCTLEVDTVDIEIHDTGPGIPAEALPKIFDPFFTTKDVGKGSGLGLFIVHEIVEEHDGCIAVDSDPVKGTSFLIRLPLK